MLRNVSSFVAMLAAFVLIGVTSMNANPANLSVGVNAGTYTEVVGGSVIYSSASPLWYTSSGTAVALPFTFSYGGVLQSTIWVHGDGAVSFGSALSGSTINHLGASGAATGVITAMSTWLAGHAGGTVQWSVTGVSPNRVVTVQWKDATRSYMDNLVTSGRDLYNFQIKIFESNTTINRSRMEIVYGPMTVRNAVNMQIGIGANNNVWCAQVHPYLNSWTAPTWNTTAVQSMMTPMFVPASGTTYSFLLRQAPETNNDAGVIALVSPAGKFDANSTQNIQIRIRNWGTANLDSVTINWSMDGLTQVPVRYYPQPALAPLGEATITLGTRTFADRSMTRLSFNTLSPNGVADVNANNDNLTAWVAPRVSGAFNIALNGNPGVFTSFQSFFRHISIAGISGNVDASVFTGTYDEQMVVPVIDAINSGRVQISPRGSDAVLLSQNVLPSRFLYSATGVGSVVALETGASNLWLRNMNMRVAEGSTAVPMVYSQDIGNNVRIDGGVLEGPTNFIAITTGASTNSVMLVSGTNGSDLIIRNATFRRHRVGALIQTSGSGAMISGNTFENVNNGLQITNAPGAVVENNVVTSCDCTTSAQAITLSNVLGGSVRFNRVNYIQTTGLANGIVATNTRDILVANNMVTLAGTSQLIGMWIESNLPVNRVLHNSVNHVGTAATNACFYSPLAVTNGQVDIINNIFHNFGSTGANGQLAMWFPSGTTPNPIRTGDFNNLLTTGANVVNWGGILVARTLVGNPLTAWRATSLRDNNSAAVTVNFVGGTDLHLNSVQNQLWGAGTLFGVVPTDYDGEPRSKPYMGADEIRPSIRMIRNPTSKYVCLGGTDTLVCIAEVTVGATTTYQWFKDGNELTGQVGNIFVISNAGYGAAGVYECLVKANDGTNFVQLRSDAASIIVVRPTQITEHPASMPVALGGSANLSVAAEAIGAPTNFIPTYQWMKRFWNASTVSYNDTLLQDNGRITGTRASVLTIREVTAADTADTYVCRVTGFCGVAISKTARLFIPLVVASSNTPAICGGGVISIECSAYPSSLPGANASFQWYKNGVMINNGGGTTGANSKVINVANATVANNGDYNCIVSYGDAGFSFTSNTVTVEVGTAPVISAQPEGTTLCEGATITLSGTSSGKNLNYQWMKGTTAIPFATQPTFTKPSSSVTDAGSYSLVVSNSCGEATSITVDVVVNTGAKITTEPADAAIAEGVQVRLVVVTSGSGTLAYQWYHKDLMIAGATGATYTIASAQQVDAGGYRCVVSNVCGADTSRTAIVSLTTGVTGDVVAGDYMFTSAKPNPTFDNAMLTYTIPATQNVRIAVTDLMGRELSVLVNENVSAGTHRVEFSTSAMNVTAGVYNVTISTNGFVATQQVVVIK